MALAKIKEILCCFRVEDEEVTTHHHDETSRLIQPEALEPQPSSSNTPFVDQQKLQERLEMIVRAKEGKMVNVASQIPFNLHNQAIPPEILHRHQKNRHGYGNGYGNTDTDSHPHSSSTSVSGTYTPPPYNSKYGHLHPKYYEPPSRAASLSPTRSLPAVPQNPILNIRLVKYEPKEDRRRGRSRERRKLPSGLGVSVPVGDGSASEEDGEEVLTPRPGDSAMEPLKFNLKDLGAIALSWSD